ncbi:acyl-CoA synthetase [uncultured Hyphomonas sp.]|uniref:acyl-CoA synthetase n=1 Tax=uncultured Hyphomonas sp. TaxID=225298 RepID=UPI00374813A4
MHPSIVARNTPDKPAIIFPQSGRQSTYGEMDANSNRIAHLLRSVGLRVGDVIAVLSENHPRIFDIAWAAQRSGLYYVMLPSRMTAEEAGYIIRDSGATALIVSSTVGDTPAALSKAHTSLIKFSFGGPLPGYRDLDREMAEFPPEPIADECAGLDMLYSSGTTGRPKGIRRPLPGTGIGAPDPLCVMAERDFGMTEDSVYLSPAPLYHAAPLRWTMVVQRIGGTVIAMEKFDAETALELIDRYNVTHSQWVPTNFVRMLKLPEEARSAHDLSSHVCAVHAAAPCPVSVKEQMIDWWGPILFEYYGGTEGAGFCQISPQEWLARKGSVGKATKGILRICDEDGDPLPAGEIGDVFFEGGPDFSYHNDPEKTAESRNKHGWRTFGDVGYVDKEGYLFLTDRKKFMIISGGVNIYPQEIENAFLAHPLVQDAAVFGVPDDEFGERVVAVIEPRHWVDAGPDLEAELSEFIRTQVSRIKAPKEIHFQETLPREPTGKLMKKKLQQTYVSSSDN